jgi:biotin synthase-related radical SAM superfamily protein
MLIKPVCLITVIPDKVRVSVGTAAVLGLMRVRLDAPPTTAYLMTYTEDGCIANCAFCSQARESHSKRSMLSRVIWPEFSTELVLKGLEAPEMEVIERVCVQVINYPGFIDDVVSLLKAIREATDLPVSIDTCPVGMEELKRLREAGAERISIPLDAATQEIFDKVKGRSAGGPYRWEAHMEALRAAKEIFGKGNVMSNLIIGLGETEREALSLIQTLRDLGIQMVLYAFTPLPETKLAGRPQPVIESYRRIQVARHLITEGSARLEDMKFDESGRLVSFGTEVDIDAILGEALRTTGCPGCNRPYYNERPSGPFYNYPRGLNEEELIMERRRLEDCFR